MSGDKLHLGWEEVYGQSLKLAELIKAAGEQFDYMVVVPRGGYFVANVVARELDFGVTKLLHAGVGSYDSGQGNQRPELSIGEMPTVETVRGKSLLIIDEVCDSGETLAFVTDYFNKSGAKLVKSGVLHYKPINSRAGYKPDWFVEQTDKWVVYPWEEREYTPNY